MALSRDVQTEMRRPAIFVLLFWSVLITVVVVWVLDAPDIGRPFGPIPLALSMLVLIAAWMAMPWSPEASDRRKAVVVVFTAVAFVLCLGTFFMWALPLYAIAVANTVFVFGIRNGMLLSATTPGLVFAGTYLYSPGQIGVGGSLFFAGLMVPVAAFVIGICTALVDAIRSRQDAHRLLGDLEAANARLRQQAERIRELATAEERTRHAREMHDTLGHYLTAINLQLQNAERFEDRDPSRSRQKIREARESTLAALGEVRRSVRAMAPETVATEGGVAALRALVRSFDGMAFSTTFDVRGHERPLPDHVELALYRATQEGLTNAARHARASAVDVSLAIDDESARLVIRDDGRGASADALEGGFGLAALRDRIEGLGGTMVARNAAAEGGFRLDVTLPLGAGLASGGVDR